MATDTMAQQTQENFSFPQYADWICGLTFHWALGGLFPPKHTTTWQWSWPLPYACGGVVHN